MISWILSESKRKPLNIVTALRRTNTGRNVSFIHHWLCHQFLQLIRRPIISWYLLVSEPLLHFLWIGGLKCKEMLKSCHCTRKGTQVISVANGGIICKFILLICIHDCLSVSYAVFIIFRLIYSFFELEIFDFYFPAVLNVGVLGFRKCHEFLLFVLCGFPGVFLRKSSIYNLIVYLLNVEMIGNA